MIHHRQLHHNTTLHHTGVEGKHSLVTKIHIVSLAYSHTKKMHSTLHYITKLRVTVLRRALFTEISQGACNTISQNAVVFSPVVPASPQAQAVLHYTVCAVAKVIFPHL